MKRISQVWTLPIHLYPWKGAANEHKFSGYGGSGAIYLIVPLISRLLVVAISERRTLARMIVVRPNLTRRRAECLLAYHARGIEFTNWTDAAEVYL